MWVSDDTDFSDGSMNDKTFTLTVNVYADGKVFFPTVKSFAPSPLTFDLLLVAVAFTVTLSTLFLTLQLYSVVALSKVRGLGEKI